MKWTLALDQATRTTGWAVYHDGNLVTRGHFSISASLGIQDRLVSFTEYLEKLISKYHIQKIYYESIQYQNNIETYKKLAYIQAMILYKAAKYHIPISGLSASHWRKIIKEKHGTSFGRSRAEQKKKAREFVWEHFNQEVTEDEADAICLGYAGILEDRKTKSAF